MTLGCVILVLEEICVVIIAKRVEKRGDYLYEKDFSGSNGSFTTLLSCCV